MYCNICNAKITCSAEELLDPELCESCNEELVNELKGDMYDDSSFEEEPMSFVQQEWER